MDTTRTRKFALTIVLLLLVTAVLPACAPTPEAEELPSPTDIPQPTDTPEPTAVPEPTVTQAPADVVVDKGVLYVTAVDPEASDQYLDIYHLPGSNEKKPVIIWTHGSGDNKSSSLTLGRGLAKEGFVVLSLNWADRSLSNQDTGLMREAIENAECALRFAAENAEALGADPVQVIWTGVSAGAWIGSLISFAEGDIAADWDAFAAENDGPQQRVECVASAEPAQVTSYVGSAGLYLGDFWHGDPVFDEWTASFAPLQTNSAIGNNPDLNVRIIHGELDTRRETSFENAERFALVLEEEGYDVAFLPQNGGHMPFYDVVIEQVGALAE